MPDYNAQVLVLHRMPLGETDRIVTLFSREHGKIRAVAKGARRPGSRLGGATELFVHADVQLATGRSLDILKQVSVRSSYSAVRTDLGMLARATYLCELTDHLVGEDRHPHPEIFDLLDGALMQLTDDQAAGDAVLCRCILSMMVDLGYAPELDCCLRCGAAQAAVPCGFSPLMGGILCDECITVCRDDHPLSPASLCWLRQAVQPHNKQAEAPTRQVLQEIEPILRWYVRVRTDRELKSAEFLDRVRETG
jgi:DNA repair protein RecO (recombination protein O)